MAQPLYFLTGISREKLEAKDGELNQAILRAAGIAETFGDCDQANTLRSSVNIGPGGQSGCLLTYQRPDGQVPERTGYSASTHDWHRINENLWIGLDHDSPPTAEDLERPQKFGGYWVPLAVGRWLVPTVRRPDGSTELPRDLKLSPWREVIKARYREQWEEAGTVVDWVVNGTMQLPQDLPRAVEIGVKALGLNYRYGLAEHEVLGVIDSTNWLMVLHAMSDLEKVADVIESKKKAPCPEPTAMNGSPGEGADCPITVPPEAT